MLNSIGLQNPGIDAFVEENLPRLAALGVPIWVSVGGFSAVGLCARSASGSTSDDAVDDDRAEPLVPERRGGARDRRASSSPRPAPSTSKPLYAKLSPATWDVAESARAVAAAGADGLSLDQHDPRPRARSRHRAARSSRAVRAATRGLPCGRSRLRASTPAPRRSTCRSWAWAAIAHRPRRAGLRGGRRERRRARNDPLLGSRGRRAASPRRASPNPCRLENTYVRIEQTLKALQIG